MSSLSVTDSTGLRIPSLSISSCRLSRRVWAVITRRDLVSPLLPADSPIWIQAYSIAWCGRDRHCPLSTARDLPLNQAAYTAHGSQLTRVYGCAIAFAYTP